MSGWLSQIVAAALGDKAPAAPAGRAVPVIGPEGPVVVAPPPRFAWDEKRWRRSPCEGGYEVTGDYRVWDRRRREWRRFRGRVTDRRGEVSAYVADPPPEVKSHPHGKCLQLVNPPWFRLHWNRRPRNVDDALLHLERLLSESLNQGRS